MKTLQKMNAVEWSQKVKQTRYYGSTYIPIESRIGLTDGNIRYSWRYYGRSALGGGHKHKAYAHYIDSGKPVPTRDI